MARRVLIVGGGSMGSRHARLIRQSLPDADIRVLMRDPDRDLPEGANARVIGLEDALAFKPELAVIANPATRHLETAIPLARSGAHLLMEKPLSATCTGVGELIDAARDSGVALLIGYNLRYAPSLGELYRLVRQGVIGRCLGVRAEVGQFLPSWRPDADYRQGVSARQALGGGVLLELSHELDYLRWIFGAVRSVQAVVARQSSLEIDVEDTAELLMQFEPAGESAAVVASVHLDFVRRDITRMCTVVGERGTLRWNGIVGCVDLYSAESGAWETVFTSELGRDATYIAQWSHFLACVAGSDTPRVTGEDGLAVLRIVEAARAAASTGRRVDLVSG